MEILKNVQIISGPLLEHSKIFVAVIIGILSIIGVIITNKIKHNYKVSKKSKVQQI